MTTKPYALAEGEGRNYEWHGVLFTIKAAAAETGGALSIWEVTTRTGEEPQVHMHEEDEIFYVLSGSVTFDCGGQSFRVNENGFMFLPRGIPHRYTIESSEARLLGFSTPSGFGDHIEQTGRSIQQTGG
jgi:mannose-6-phosphate isomerase-like protein (cupin superfamily)